jgi:RNA polymerase sigma-70 factor (ECF subfamily)
LVERHFGPVARFFGNKTANPSDVEDLVAETFERCTRNIGGFEGRGSFRSYLFSVAYRTLADYHRRLHKQTEIEFDEASIVDMGGSPSSHFGRKQGRRLLLDALRRLPAISQVVLELSVFEGLSRSDIAVILELPEGTVASRLRRGRSALDETLMALARSPAELQSTQDSLTHWVERIAAEARKRAGSS